MNQIPNGFDLLNFLTPTPHQPSGYHYQSLQVYHHHVCCWQLSLAWFLLEEKSWSYGSWDFGEEIYTETEMGFCWGIGEFQSSNQISFKLESFGFPLHKDLVKVASVSNLLILLLGYGSKYSPPNGWMIGKHEWSQKPVHLQILTP